MMDACAAICNDENLVSAVLLSATALAPRAVFAREAKPARLDIFSTRKRRAKKEFFDPILCSCSAFFAVLPQRAASAISRGDFSL